MTEQQDKLVEALNNIGMDIREIKTTLRHFENRFNEKVEQIEQNVSGIRIQVGENEHEIERLKIKFVREEEKNKDYGANIDRLFEKHRENEKEAKSDRRWLVGTIITVIGMLIGYAFKFAGM